MGRTRKRVVTLSTISYTCITCGKTYTSSYSRDLHCRVSHPNSTPNVSSSQICHLCNKRVSPSRQGYDGYCKCHMR